MFYHLQNLFWGGSVLGGFVGGFCPGDDECSKGKVIRQEYETI